MIVVVTRVSRNSGTAQRQSGSGGCQRSLRGTLQRGKAETSILRLFEGAHFLTGTETNGFAGGNGDFGAGARVAAHPGLARPDAEHAKPTQFDAVAPLQTGLHAAEDRF